ARDLMGDARLRDCLNRRLDLRRSGICSRGSNAERHAEVAWTDQDRTETRNRENIIDVLDAVACFDHPNGQEFTVGVEWPDICFLRVFQLRQPPVSDRAKWSPSPYADRRRILAASLRTVAHRLHSFHRLSFRFDVRDDNAHDSRVQNLFDCGLDV